MLASISMNPIVEAIEKTKTVSIDIVAGSKLYDLLLAHIAATAPNGKSYYASAVPPNHEAKKKGGCSSCSSCGPEVSSSPSDRIKLSAGLGTFEFKDHHDNSLYACHRTIGDPVGTDCGIKMYHVVTVSSADPNGRSIITKLFGELVEKSEHSEEGVINIYHYHVKYQYWRQSAAIKARPMESVILPTEVTSSLLKDLDKFRSAQDFYEKHGIPYRRAYLFYGVPGSGKTSLIQALAGAYHKSISYLNIHPDMTDDSLRGAIDDLPNETIVVLEDIDALFTKDRKAKQEKSTLTFSGLLNALDGVGSSTGQIFILTTNLRDQLDSALIRNGRVDLHVKFDYATDEQIKMMWRSFYPPAAEATSSGSEEVKASADPVDPVVADDLAVQFCTTVREKLKGRTVTCSALQHFFVMQRDVPAEEAVLNVDCLIEDMEQKAVESEEDEATKKAEKDKDAGTDGASDSGSKDSKDSQAKEDKGDKDDKKQAVAEAPQQHIHVHIHKD